MKTLASWSRSLALSGIAVVILLWIVGVLTGLGALGWFAWQHAGRISWGDVFSVVILIAICVVAKDMHNNFSELRLRLHALERTMEGMRQTAERREPEQQKWRP